MVKKYLGLIFTVLMYLVLVQATYGQMYVSHTEVNDKVKKLYDEALTNSRENKYSKAIKLLNKAISKEPRYIDAYLLKSGMYYNIKEYDEAIQVMKTAIDLGPDYDPQAYYSLAILYKQVKDYAKAAEQFKEFLERDTEGKKVERAKMLLKQSLFADLAINNPVPFEPIKLGNKINTSESEYMPRLTIDGKKIIFTRRVNGQEDFYMAIMMGDSILSCEPIDELNTPQNEGVHTISSDGKKIIYTACDRPRGEGSCDLYYSELIDTAWTDEISLNPTINTPAWDGQPSLSSDGNIIFYSSSRPGGKGGRDIWFSVRSDTSGWSQPYNMTAINTAGNEESPFLHPDGRTFYFRSDGRIGMGGYDIYYTRFNFEKRNWDEPKNIGYPINTEGSEGGLTISLDGKYAYFASDMDHLNKMKDLRNLDIYKFELYDEVRPIPTTYVKAYIIDAETGEPLEAQYTIRNQNQDFIADKGTAIHGSFLSALPAFSNYACIIDMPGYVYHSEHFKLDSVKNVLQSYELNIHLQKIKEETTVKKIDSKPIVMENIFFVSGSAQLMDESTYELDYLYKTLISNPNIIIKIIGHTDNIGKKEDNMKLSKDRALSVVEYLKTKGIDDSRLLYEGKGETQPIADNNTAEGRLLNRRTEFIIL